MAAVTGKNTKRDPLEQSLARARGLLAQGDFATAIPFLQQITERWSKSALAWVMFGDAMHATGNLPGALVAFQKAVRLDAGVADLQQRLAETAFALERWELAIGALEALPGNAMNRARLAIAWQALGKFEQAGEQYAQALAAGEPALAYTLHLNLGTCWHQLQRYRAAAEQAQLAAAAASDDEQRDVAWRNEGSASLEHGDVRAARAAFAKSRRAASSALYAANFLSPYDPQAVLDEHRRWGELAERQAAAEPGIEPIARALAANEALRIGFVSADFRQHPVSFFFAGLLGALHANGCQCVLYADVQSPDDTSERLRRIALRWVDCRRMSNADLARQVAADGIDVLVDLGGHTSERIGFFAARRAPVQVEYLGYAATTGLRTFDAYLSDPLLDPPSEGNAHFVETLLRLDGPSMSYCPPADLPAVSALPALRAGQLSFASFNRPHKLNEQTLSLWAGVLKALPDSRLLLVGKGFGEPEAQAALSERFAALGVAAERLHWRGQIGFADYLALHGEVDLILDCQPWSGHTVTLHAAMMGVPTLTLRGQHHAGRFSAAVMQLIGHPDWVADSAPALVQRAVAIAADLPALNALRQQLRRQVLTSPLLDHAALAGRFEQALRGLLTEKYKNAQGLVGHE